MFQPTAASPPLPTSFLPPLKLLDALSAASISLILAQLRQLYQPLHLQPSHYRRLLILEPAIDSGYASDDEYTPDEDQLNDEAWEIARADPLERTYAIRWMTGFVARSEDFVSRCPSDHEAEDRERVVDAMIAFLGSLAQTSESGDLHREFIFNLHPNASVSSREVNVVLKDANLSSTDHTSVGLQVGNSTHHTLRSWDIDFDL
jgi:protein-lysine N-methyltransferase EEF2KMT